MQMRHTQIQKLLVIDTTLIKSHR